ncbi:MAG: type II secretion system major pseudopilin GspG [Pseudomonadota bacterium]
MRHTRPLRRTAPHRSQAGMTLIEIMIVIVLIGGVLAVVGGSIFGNKDKANHKLARIQVDKVAAMVEQYNDDVGEYPRSLEDLVADPQINGWLGPYAQEKDLKDPFNKPLQYTVPGENGAFDLISYGKDGRPGGSSVDGDIRYGDAG